MLARYREGRRTGGVSRTTCVSPAAVPHVLARWKRSVVRGGPHRRLSTTEWVVRPPLESQPVDKPNARWVPVSMNASASGKRRHALQS